MKYNIQIAALCETGIYDSGIKTIGDYTLIYSGLPSESKTKSVHGVAICLDKAAAMVWKDSGTEWEAINERIVKIRLLCTPITVTFIAVYAPVNPVNNSMMQASENFYRYLQQTIDKVPKQDMLILMGDFNARINQQQISATFRIIGPYTVDTMNENGERLADFCTVNNLVITNSFYQHKTIHQTSWRHPGTKKWHLLDYTLVNIKFRSTIHDVRFYRRAIGSIGTDHHLMRAKIKLHLKCKKKRIRSSHLRLDRTKLEDKVVIERFQQDLAKQFNDVKENVVDVDGKYEIFVQCLKKTADKHLKLKKNNQLKQKEWLTKEILDAVDKNASMYLEWQQHRGSSLEKKSKNQYVKARKLVKILIDKRQIEFWDELSAEIESAVKRHDPATVYAMIRKLKGGRQKVENMPIFDKHGILLGNSTKRLSRWREFFSELLNVHSVVDRNLLNQIQPAAISAIEEYRQNIELTMEEVQQAVEQMRSRKAPGNDQIIVDLLKAGGVAVIEWLHQIFVEIWKNEKIVECWSSAILIRLYKNKGDKRSCDNYRGISLLVVASKIFTRVILNRIQHVIDSRLLEQQAGFRPNRSTMDSVFIVKMIMEKSREFNKPLHMVFIDIQKAYDSVNRELLWRICRSYGITEKLVRILKLTYKNSNAQVRINNELSEAFDIVNGVMQGGISFPILFNIVFDFIIRQVLDQANMKEVKLAYGSNDFFTVQRNVLRTFIF